MPLGLAGSPSCPQVPRPKATGSGSISVPEAPPLSISRPPPPVLSKWCNQRQLFKLGERSPPSPHPASGGWRTCWRDPGVLGSWQSLRLQSPSPPGLVWAGVWGPCILRSFCVLSWGLPCPSPISTPSLIVISSNFRARKGNHWFSLPHLDTLLWRCRIQGYSTSVSVGAQPGVSACLRPPLCPTFRTPVFGVEDKESHAEGPDLALFIHPCFSLMQIYISAHCPHSCTLLDPSHSHGAAPRA